MSSKGKHHDFSSSSRLSPNEKYRLARLLAQVKECAQSRDLRRGMRAHRQAVSDGLFSNTFVVTSLINMYAKCGSMLDARELFESLSDRNVVAWTSLIWGYVTNGQSELALEMFESMEGGGGSCSPNSRTYVAALSACSSLASKANDRETRARWLQRGQALRDQAVMKRCCDLFVENMLLSMYAKSNCMANAQHVFDNMMNRDVVTWNTLLQGYVDSGESRLALDFFDAVRGTGTSAVVPNERTYIAAVSACASLSLEEGASQRWLNKGKAIHSLTVALKCSSVFLDTALVDMYSKCGSMALAHSVFDNIVEPTVVSWTALITGYVDNGKNRLALQMVGRMDLCGTRPNSLTFVAALEACGNLMDVKVGEELERDIQGVGLHVNTIVMNSLIGFYGKCGDMKAALKTFISISEKTVVSWTSLMCGYSAQGDTEQVLRLFETMKEQRVPFNDVTFVCVLAACNYAGLTERGKEHFNAMLPVYGVRPDIRHYNCMVDLLGRANHIEEALKLIGDMPLDLKPNVVTWKTVLSACVKWNDAARGRLAYEALMKPDFL